eukprot:2694478-Amphidinium_carterae.2
MEQMKRGLPTQDQENMKNKFDELADYVVNIVSMMTSQSRIFSSTLFVVREDCRQLVTSGGEKVC